MKKPLYKIGQLIFYEGVNYEPKSYVNYNRAIIEEIYGGLKGIFYVIKPIDYKLGSMPIQEEDIYIKLS